MLFRLSKKTKQHKERILVFVHSFRIQNTESLLSMNNIEICLTTAEKIQVNCVLCVLMFMYYCTIIHEHKYT